MSDYLSALWVHWVALMSGVLSVLIALGLRAGRRVSGTVRSWPDIPDRLFLAVGILALFYAGYLTWNDEHKNLVALQENLRTPEFGGEIRIISTAPTGSKKQDTFVTCAGTITNPYGPPSALMDFNMYLEFPDGRRVAGYMPFYNGKDLHLQFASDPKKEAVLDGKRFWPSITIATIPAGGQAAGWMAAFFTDMLEETVRKQNVTLVLEFTDTINGKRHHLTKALNAGNEPMMSFGEAAKR